MESTKTEFLETEFLDWWLPGLQEAEMGDGGQRVQISSYKINKSGDVMYIMVTTVNNMYCILENC